MKIKILKRNQIILATISLMLIAAGYLNYSSDINSAIATAAISDSEEIAGLGDARLVSSSSVVEENMMDNSMIVPNNENESDKSISTSASPIEEKNNDKDNSNSQNNDSKDDNSSQEDYFTKTRLERQTMYSQMLESYDNVLNNPNISSEQKSISQKEIIKINNTKNGIMIAENLIKSKGFRDIIILVNEDSVNIIIKAKTLSVEQIAQLQNIVCRELDVKIENVHISTKE